MSYILVQSDALRIPLPDNSVSMCVTSPPYFGLRDYGTGRWVGGDPACGHKPDPAWLAAQTHGNSTLGGPPRASQMEAMSARSFRDACGKCGARRVDRQLGLEQTPEEYCARMVAAFREVRRVLHPMGTCWINIGDSYASGGRGGTSDRSATFHGNGFREEMAGRPKRTPLGYKDKDLLGIPWMLAFALRDDGWWLRSEIIWAKPNPMPESVTDRPTKAHESVFLLAKSADYYFDAEAVREKAEYGRRDWKDDHFKNGDIRISHKGTTTGGDPESGRNMRSVLTVPTEAFPGSHFATYPRKLIEPFIKAGSSERGICPACGSPWRRLVERGELTSLRNKRLMPSPTTRGDARRDPGNRADKQSAWQCFYPITTLGWEPTCKHGLDPVPSIVLDPFCGSGTSGVVALALGRRFVGLDLSRDYLVNQAQRRIDRPHARAVRPARVEDHPLFASMGED